MKAVVVTGLGTVNALGVNTNEAVQAAWDGWLDEVERLVGDEPLEATTPGGVARP